VKGDRWYGPHDADEPAKALVGACGVALLGRMVECMVECVVVECVVVECVVVE